MSIVEEFKLGIKYKKLYFLSFDLNDKNKAIYHLNKAAEQGSLLSQFELAGLVNSNYWYKKAIDGYIKVANEGNISFQYRLGNCYYKGIGVKKDIDEGIKWYLKAAENKNEQAIISLYFIYKYGVDWHGSYIDLDKANKYMKLIK